VQKALFYMWEAADELTMASPSLPCLYFVSRQPFSKLPRQDNSEFEHQYAARFFQSASE
jgi:hypothetical protein